MDLSFLTLLWEPRESPAILWVGLREWDGFWGREILLFQEEKDSQTKRKAADVKSKLMSRCPSPWTVGWGHCILCCSFLGDIWFLWEEPKQGFKMGVGVWLNHRGFPCSELWEFPAWALSKELCFLSWACFLSLKAFPAFSLNLWVAIIIYTLLYSPRSPGVSSDYTCPMNPSVTLLLDPQICRQEQDPPRREKDSSKLGASYPPWVMYMPTCVSQHSEDDVMSCPMHCLGL